MKLRITLLTILCLIGITTKPQAQNLSEPTRKTLVEVPEVYELANVILALTEVCQADDNLLEQNTAYFKRVIAHFGAFKNHPVVLKTNDAIKKDPQTYQLFRTSGFNYDFVEGKLKRTKHIIFPKKLILMFSHHLGKVEKLAQDFAEQSKFRAFYQQEQTYYQWVINDEKRIANIDQMWTWLEERFSSRYQRYHIIISPLVAGWHNTSRHKIDGIAETRMFICSAERTASSTTDSTLFKSITQRIVFTEIDHNYVNPVSDQFKKEIEQAIPDVAKWNSLRYGYKSPMLTFNEYMTFAVFCAYLSDTYSSIDAPKVIAAAENMMVKRREFLKFKEFNQYFLNLYKTQKPKQISALYPAILEWCKSQ